MFDSLRPIKGLASTTFAVRGFGGRAVSAPWKRPDRRQSALAAGASWQDNSVRAEALRKLRRVIFMVESSFFDNMTSQPPLGRGGGTPQA